jgi:hypothetical protein
MTIRMSAALAGLALLFGTAMPAALGQARQDSPGTERPGQATRGQVWIENRGRSESIPIVAGAPLPVVVQNPIRQWEYQTLAVGQTITATELTRVLIAQGSAGWETAGVQLSSGPNTLVVMKRPLQDPRPGSRPPQP